MSIFAMTLEAGQVASLFLVMLRCIGFAATAPILGHRAVPRPVKAAFAIMLAVTLAGGAAVADGATPVILAAPVELLIGISLGYGLALGFSAVDTASRLISIQMGLSLGAVFDPVAGEASTSLSPLFAIMAGLLFLALNLHLAAIGVLADSFVALPIGGAWPVDLFGAITRLAALALEICARVATPLALVLLLAELAVALVSRAIPQINVFFLGLPLKILLGIGLFAIAIPNLVTGISSLFQFLFSGVADAMTTGIAPLPSVLP